MVLLIDIILLFITIKIRKFKFVPISRICKEQWMRQCCVKKKENIGKLKCLVKKQLILFKNN